MIDYIRQVRDDDSHQGHRPAGRQPGRVGGRLRRDLARADDRARGGKPRPLVVSMSDLAASGGYYIAVAAPSIVARAGTLTGSIGIFGGKMVTGGTYEKLGTNIEGDQHGAHADINSPVRPYIAEERRSSASSCRRSTTSSSRRWRPRGTCTPETGRCRRAGAGLDRAAGAQIGLVDALGGLDRAVAVGEAAREDPGRPATSAGRLPAAPELLRAADGSVQRRRSGGRERVGVGPRLEERAGGAAGAARAAVAVPPRRAAGVDAVCVLAEEARG